MPPSNPFDEIKSSLVDEMMSLRDQWSGMAKGTPPFNSSKLNPEEDRFVFENPSALYENYTHPQTGQPLTNAQAAQVMLDGGTLVDQQGQPKQITGMGAERYIRWVEDHAKRIQTEHADTSTGDPVVSPDGYSFGAEGGLNDLMAAQEGGDGNDPASGSAPASAG